MRNEWDKKIDNLYEMNKIEDAADYANGNYLYFLRCASKLNKLANKIVSKFSGIYEHKEESFNRDEGFIANTNFNGCLMKVMLAPCDKEWYLHNGIYLSIETKNIESAFIRSDGTRNFELTIDELIMSESRFDEVLKEIKCIRQILVDTIKLK